MSGAYEQLFVVVLWVLGIAMFACLIRAIIGPRIADRVLSINMIGTIVVMMIGILAVLQDSGYLVDVALIYALLSFLAVVVLSRIYIGVTRAHRESEAKKDA